MLMFNLNVIIRQIMHVIIYSSISNWQCLSCSLLLVSYYVI